MRSLLNRDPLHPSGQALRVCTSTRARETGRGLFQFPPKLLNDLPEIVGIVLNIGGQCLPVVDYARDLSIVVCADQNPVGTDVRAAIEIHRI